MSTKIKASIKNITLFTPENTAFDGYRVQIMRNGANFRQYISRKVHGKDALKVAIRAKTSLLQELYNKRSWTADPVTAKRVPTKAALKRLAALGFSVPA